MTPNEAPEDTARKLADSQRRCSTHRSKLLHGLL